MPFHLYSMRQAIEEGYILDVLANYTTYDTYYRLANTEPSDDPDVPTSKASAALARFVSLHPTNLAQKAEIIVEHFRQKTAGKIGGRAKAMVVTRSRLHAVRYKQAIDAYIAAKGYDHGPGRIAALVAFSGHCRRPERPDRQLHRADDERVRRRASCRSGSPPTSTRCSSSRRSTRPASTSRCCTPCTSTRSSPGSRPCRRCRGSTAPTRARPTRSCSTSPTRPRRSRTPSSRSSNRPRPRPTDPNLLYTLEHTITAAHVIHPAEQKAAVDALLAGGSANQKIIYANVNPAVGRFIALDEDTQDVFRDALKGFVRAYSFLAQVMPWTDRDLESLYLYGRALLPLLPAAPDEPLPQISESVLLTHLRTEAQGEEENLSLTSGTDEPGVALPGGGTGKAYESPTEKLSQLIEQLNQRYGMNLGEADVVWFRQQKQAIKSDEQMRVVALNNDRDQYGVVLAQEGREPDRRPSRGQRSAVQRVLREARLPRRADPSTSPSPTTRSATKSCRRSALTVAPLSPDSCAWCRLVAEGAGVVDLRWARLGWLRFVHVTSADEVPARR